MTKHKESLLTELGFTGLEAAVYLGLLEEPGATGYRVSRMISKPVPNTYKALDSLRQKGAVVLDETSGSRAYVALPIGEYLDGLKRNLDAQRSRIEHELKGMAAVTVESGIYRLTGVEQVYERCRNMLANAEDIALVDIFPRPLHELQKDLETAARRGVKVFIKAYAPVKLAGCEVLAPESDDPSLKIWDGDWVNISICFEYVQAFLKKEGAGVHEAVWSRNRYLALLTYNGMFQELTLTKVLLLLHQRKPREEIVQELRRIGRRYMEETPFRRMIEQWGKTSWEAWRVKPGRRTAAGRKENKKTKPHSTKEVGDA